MPYNTVEKGEKKMSTETKVTVRSQEQVKEKFGISNCLINFVGPSIGAHSGPGTVALFFLGKQR